jgi:hypothetical protein
MGERKFAPVKAMNTANEAMRVNTPGTPTWAHCAAMVWR